MHQATFVIAVDNDICRLGLKCIINEEYTDAIIRFVSTKVELRSALFDDYKSIVLVDNDCLDILEIDEYVDFSTKFPNVKWLFINNYIDEAFILSIASSFDKANHILKSSNYDVIALAISNTISGKKYYCKDSLQIILKNYTRKKENANKRSSLTTTELELLQLFSQGKTAKEIGEIRSLSHHTVNTHRKNIFRKLQVSNLQELIKYGLKNGLVDLTEYYI